MGRKKGESKSKNKIEALDKLDTGSHVWLRGDNDSWVLGTVSSRKGQVIKVKTDHGSSKFDLDEDETAGMVFRANEKVVADMTSLNYFHIPGILHNLRERAIDDQPYTFLGGSVLVAVNPLKRLEKLDGQVGDSKVVNTPHPFAIAETAFQQLSFALARGEDIVNQSIVVGGESGAGKTESSKYVLRHLVERGAAEKNDLDARLLDSNPILEAFGNAATKRNPNSSRFGKFLKLHFESKKKGLRIYGASVETYLLERSRVTYHSEGERTYHVFYQLCNGADKKLRKKLQLDTKFDYMTAKIPENTGSGKKGRGARSSIKLPDLTELDKENFKSLCNALQTIGLATDDSDESVQGVFKIVAGLLHLGNIEFDEEESDHGDAAKIVNSDVLETAAELLGIKKKKLKSLFLERKVKTGGETIMAKRDSESAKIALDSVVKAVYTGLFDWLVQRITESLTEKDDYEEKPFIGVLDIFGFETFRVNDFEQLLINYTNEALQKTFNDQIFRAEAVLYQKEGLLVDDEERLPPPDNQETMVLLGGRDKNHPGILSLIDAETHAPQASDAKMVSNMHRTFAKNKLFPTPHPRDVKFCFIVKHYAGEVKYTAGRFVEKNVDKLPNEVAEVIVESEMQILREIFDEAKKQGKGKRKDSGGKLSKATSAMKKSTSTVAGKFKVQIANLIETLEGTQASFIRCIKPNPLMRREKKSNIWFNNPYVMLQLENLSIPQTAEVLKGGLPTRLPFDMLIESYMNILPEEAIDAWRTLGHSDERLFVKALFFAYNIPADSYKMGLTKVFFRAGMLDTVAELLDAANGDSVPAEVVARFRMTFVRAIGRRLMMFMFAAKVFLDLHGETKKKSVVIMMQRRARRKREMIEAKAELERRRLEKQEREAEQKRREEEEFLKEQERIRREKEKAKDREEKERLRRMELEIEERAELSRKQAEEAEEQAQVSRQKYQELEEETKHAKDVEDQETEKGIEEYGGKDKWEAELKKNGGKSDEDSDDDDDDEYDARDGVKSKNGDREKRVEAMKKMKEFRSKADFLEIDKPVLFEDVHYKEVSTRVSPFACFSALLGKKKKNDINENGDDWKVCQIMIQGIQLKYFREIREDENDQPMGVGLLGTVKIDPALTSMTEREDNDETVEFLIRSSQKKIIFKLMDAAANKKLVEAYKKAGEAFEEEKKLAFEFQSGNFGGMVSKEELQGFKEALESKAITREEYEILLNQQVTQDDELLAHDAARYGEKAVPDYNIVCDECKTLNVVVPGADPICYECEMELPDTAEEREIEARAIRRQKQEELGDIISGKSQRTVLCRVRMDDGKDFLIREPTWTVAFESETQQRVYLYTFQSIFITADVKHAIAEWEFSASWTMFERFHQILSKPIGMDEVIQLPEEYMSLIPPFPKDLSKKLNKAELAEKRMPLLAQWVKSVIEVSKDIPPFFDLKFVRRFFNFPVDAKYLANEDMTNGYLTMDQLNDLFVIVDELHARLRMNVALPTKSVEVIEQVFDSLQRTADPAFIVEADLPLTDEEKMELLHKAEIVIDLARVILTALESSK